MEQFSGDDLATGLLVLETIKCGWAHARPQGDADFAFGPRRLEREERAETARHLKLADNHISKCGLRTSVEAVREFGGVLLAWESPYLAEIAADNVVARIEEIERTIKREMRSILFMYLPADRALRYNQEEPFGGKVATAFPSAKFDLQESGNCYSLSPFTASVFHLMRALEVALTTFAAQFGITMSHTNWQPIIEQLESKIRDLSKASSKTAADKNLCEFYAQAASSFMFLKDAWRNYTAHVRGRYVEQEADTIYRNVGAFMQKLANGGIRERETV